MPRVDLTLGQQVILRALEAPGRAKRELVPDARVALKVNARGEVVVFAVVVPTARVG